MRKWFHEWQKLNPILADGEVGEIIGMLITKTGDGKSTWKELSYDSTVIPSSIPFATLADVSGKQDTDTAATDIELSAAVNALDSRITTLEAAPVSEVTQAELDAVISSVATKQDSATAATQAELDAEATARASADTALDGRVGTLEAASGAPAVAQERITITDANDLTYVLTNTPSSAAALQVFLNGILLQQTVDYTLDAATVTFTATVIAVNDVVTFSYTYGV